MKVVVINKGFTYTTHSEMAKKLRVENWDKYHTPIVNQVYEFVRSHKEYKYEYCYIRDRVTGKGYIIERQGIMEDNLFLYEEDFLLL